MDAKPDLAVYVLARTDLPSMNPGKLAAQVHHAGVQMMALMPAGPLTKAYVADGIEQGADHFNTTIVLGATLDDIKRIERQWDHTWRWGVVVDPSYPFLVESLEIADLIPQTDTTKIVKVLDNGRVLMTRSELTVAWALGDRNDPKFRALFDSLDLHP